ncbi:MAG: hypothetical protein IMZ61_03585 [Planctomycetes bacterium]|nr:hypothetical protein [Planctomycetota bacterium]
MMNVFVREIPFIELLLVFAMLGLGGLGFFSLLRRRNPTDLMKYGSTGKWILAGLIGLAVLAIILLFVVSLVLL